MKKFCIAVLCAALLSLCFAGCDKKGAEVEIIGPKTTYTVTQKGVPEPVFSVSYDVIGGKDVMPIGGWWGPHTPTSVSQNGQLLPDYVTDEYFELFSNAGVNIITATPNIWATDSVSIKKALELSAKYGMGYYVNDPYIHSIDNIDTMEERLKEYMGYESCVGIHMKDEPYMNEFDNMGKIYEAYAKLNYDKQHLYTNLWPDHGLNLSGDPTVSATYKEYLTTFMEKLKPAFISYDFYPFTDNSQSSKNQRYYFQNLSVVRTVANDYGVPFWVFIQAGGQWESAGKPSKEEYYPTEAAMMWNINTSLAYGAKSLQYFTLIEPDSLMTTDNGVDFERLGMVGAGGNINRWYYYAQKANKHIAAIDYVLMNASNIGIIAEGTLARSYVTGPELLKDGKFRQLKSVDAEEVIVGCFDYLGGTALYVVNNSSFDKQNVTLNFDEKYGYDVIQRAQKISVTATNLPLILEPGEGALVVLR